VTKHGAARLRAPLGLMADLRSIIRAHQLAALRPGLFFENLSSRPADMVLTIGGLVVTSYNFKDA
jgi:hypothetical protein